MLWHDHRADDNRPPRCHAASLLPEGWVWLDGDRRCWCRSHSSPGSPCRGWLANASEHFPVSPGWGWAFPSGVVSAERTAANMRVPFGGALLPAPRSRVGGRQWANRRCRPGVSGAIGRRLRGADGSTSASSGDRDLLAACPGDGPGLQCGTGGAAGSNRPGAVADACLAGRRSPSALPLPRRGRCARHRAWEMIRRW